MQQSPDADCRDDERQQVSQVVSERVQPVKIIVERETQIGQRPVLEPVLKSRGKKRLRAQAIN